MALNQANWVVTLPFTNKVFKDFSICLYCLLMLSYVYYVLDSILCLINRSLSYALIGFLYSVYVQVLFKRIKYGKEQQNWSREIRSKRKLQVGFFTILFNVLVIEKVENDLHCCSRLSY